MKVFIQKLSFTRGIYRAYCFAGGRWQIGSSLKSFADAVSQLDIEHAEDKDIPEEYKDILEEFK